MLLKRLMTASRKMMRLELKQPKPNLTKPKRRKKTKKLNTSMRNPLNCQPPRRSSCFVVIPWVKTDKSAQKAENVQCSSSNTSETVGKINKKNYCTKMSTTRSILKKIKTKLLKNTSNILKNVAKFQQRLNPLLIKLKMKN